MPMNLRIENRFLTVLLSIVLSLQSYARDTTLFARMSESFRVSCVEISYSYSTVINGIKTVGSGELTVQGLCYIMKGDGLEVVSDGRDMWVLDRSSKEVVITSVDRSSFEAMANPVVLVMDMERFFSIKESVETDSGAAVEYLLQPKEDTGMKEARVIVLKKDASITSLSFILDDGVAFEIKVNNFRHLPLKESDAFVCPSSMFDYSWVVTDLRQ